MIADAWTRERKRINESTVWLAVHKLDNSSNLALIWVNSTEWHSQNAWGWPRCFAYSGGLTSVKTWQSAASVKGQRVSPALCPTCLPPKQSQLASLSVSNENGKANIVASGREGVNWMVQQQQFVWCPVPLLTMQLKEKEDRKRINKENARQRAHFLCSMEAQVAALVGMKRWGTQHCSFIQSIVDKGKSLLFSSCSMFCRWHACEFKCAFQK